MDLDIIVGDYSERVVKVPVSISQSFPFQAVDIRDGFARVRLPSLAISPGKLESLSPLLCISERDVSHHRCIRQYEDFLIVSA